MSTYATTTDKFPVEAGSIELTSPPVPIEEDFTVLDPTYASIVPDNAEYMLSFEDLCVETIPSRVKDAAVDAFNEKVYNMFHRNAAKNYSTRVTPPKKLIKNINGLITGGLCAIMGPSGSGKTTFLSTLALRLDNSKMKMTGSVKLNGKAYNKSLLKAISGYVMQDDLVHTEITVFETLLYTAQLRMPKGVTTEQIKKRINEVINLVDISHCRNVVIGDSRFKGISGGERKRLCIAMELLSKPQLLFLDEPTSGLDSANALAISRVLKHLSANRSVTVVCTIHQPQSKIFELFDNLILMKSGMIIYQGNACTAVDYFEKQGYPLPKTSSQPDHLIDILLPDYEHNEEEKSASEKYNIIISSEIAEFSNHDHCKFDNVRVAIKQSYLVSLPEPVKKELVDWWSQFCVLTRRSFYFHLKRYDILLMNVFITMLVATFICMSTWYKIGTGKYSSTRRQPALFFCVIHQGIVSSLQGMHSFPLERAIMLRERSAGSYHVSAYFLAKTISDMFVQLFPPIIFTCIVYPIIGFQSSAKKFFIFMAFMILDSAAATALTNMVSCFCVSIQMSTVLMAATYEIVRLYGGWFISPAQISSYADWKFADTLSYIKYAFVAVSLNENDGLVITCAMSERTPAYAIGDQTTSNCKISPLTTMPYDGSNYNSYYGYDSYTISECAGALVGYILIARFLSYIALRFIKV